MLAYLGALFILQVMKFLLELFFAFGSKDVLVCHCNNT